MKKDPCFVFVVCGDAHAARLNVALRYLRRFSRSGIAVVKGRTRARIECERVLEPPLPAGLSDHQASIFLKTSLHRTLPQDGRTYCYLDSDVIAVDPGVDEVFRHALPPVAFANDQCNLMEFSRYAVRCGCQTRECDHLRLAIKQVFGVRVGEKRWRHWNGGVFVFDRAAAGFMELWHRNTLEVFGRDDWQVRDQGSLVAAAWKAGLQDQPTLPREFNFIVDPYDGVPKAEREGVPDSALRPNERYSLDGAPGKARPRLLHFINGGVGRRGWKNWADAARLLARRPRAAGAAPRARAPRRRVGRLSADNRVVHGLWIGAKLSKMELLTLKSFLRHGHDFHLWVYEKPETPLPEGVVLNDANEIVPSGRIIRKAENDPETGVGKGSFSSPFSDLFRYKLLHEKGGYWVDMDVTCLRPLDFEAPYVFRSHRVGVVGNLVKCPPRSELMKRVYENVRRRADAHSSWLMPNRVLSRAVNRLGLSRYVLQGVWNEESWWHAVRPLALENEPIPLHWCAIHWINEFWRTLQQDDGCYRGKRMFQVTPDKNRPHPASALARLYAEYGLADKP